MTFSDGLVVPLSQTKIYGEAQSIIFVISTGRACPVRVYLKRRIDEVTLLKFDPISVKRLVQPDRNDLLQLPE